MVMESFPYKNGLWVWDDEEKTVQFVSHETQEEESYIIAQPVQKYAKPPVITSIRFKEAIETAERIHFRRYFQRHIRPPEPEIISLQDIKDVALFCANRRDLTPEFIVYFHLPEVDRFLRACIAYFQFFLQVWDNLVFRRKEAKRKIRQPIVEKLENIVRDDLSDLRSIMAREYCVVIMGIGKSAKFHHLSKGRNSLSEKDRRLIEALFCMTVRVIWIALQRRSLNLIELELNKMMRTDYFNIIAHRTKHPSRHLFRTQLEDRVLQGCGIIKESKLKQRSALLKELLYGTQDFRLLGVGIKEFDQKDERSIYMENLLGAPEEILYTEFGMTVGLIGIPREEYDCMMFPKERTSQNFDKPLIEPLEYQFPKRTFVPSEQLPKQFSTKPSKFKESEYTQNWRKIQCKIWYNLITNKTVVGQMKLSDSDSYLSEHKRSSIPFKTSGDTPNFIRFSNNSKHIKSSI